MTCDESKEEEESLGFRVRSTHQEQSIRCYYHATVLEGVAKSQFPLKAVVFKSGEP